MTWKRLTSENTGNSVSTMSLFQKYIRKNNKNCPLQIWIHYWPKFARGRWQNRWHLRKGRCLDQQCMQIERIFVEISFSGRKNFANSNKLLVMQDTRKTPLGSLNHLRHSRSFHSKYQLVNTRVTSLFSRQSNTKMLRCNPLKVINVLAVVISIMHSGSRQELSLWDCLPLCRLMSPY